MTSATDKHLQCWGSATYNRVETERQIPKLKLFLLENLVNVQNKKVIFTLKRVKYEHLQEFQYGKETVQTTTNKEVRARI